MSDVSKIILRNLGIEIPAERADAIARTLETMLEAERAATGRLQFEQEPSGFLSEIEKEIP